MQIAQDYLNPEVKGSVLKDHILGMQLRQIFYSI